MSPPRKRKLAKFITPEIKIPDGIIVIVNIYKNRQGSQRDVQALLDLCKTLNIERFERDVHADLASDKISNLMNMSI